MSELFEFYKNQLGHYLRTARQRMGWSLRDLEERSGVSNAQIYRIERGDFNCALDTFVRLTTALGLPFVRVLEEMATCVAGRFVAALAADKYLASVMDGAGIRQVQDRGICSDFLAVSAALIVDLLFSSDPVRRLRRLKVPPIIREQVELFARGINPDMPAQIRLDYIDRLEQRCLDALSEIGVISKASLPSLLLHVVDRGWKKGIWIGTDSDDFPDWLPFPPGLPSLESAQERKSVVDDFQEIEYESSVSLTWKQLKSRLKAASVIPGNKAAMARAAKVNQSSVNSWLDDDREPGAEATFRLLEWVAAEEAKQKGPEGATTPARPKTQHKDTNESKLTSGRKKK